ncbi:hypothetical protein GIB67_024722 [Kingdonia uniflora]|uniref:non-specific serine/threonine protein kinase n=1 Tax=Kingdonia uniflora TaxID=39325 RepID=A0A7J7N9P5_9MAGN|nr:hypothetical protein GIB67_024722 [Kingdonia uniflora]
MLKTSSRMESSTSPIDFLKSTLSKLLSDSTKPSSKSTSTSTKTSSSLRKKSISAFQSELTFSESLKSFRYRDLKTTTRNFRDILAEGGLFGRVYKGWLDVNKSTLTKPGSGIVVAIKKLNVESFQSHSEWLAEVFNLGQIHHENLVKLIGYCSEFDNRLLVYEFLPRGCLENHLFRRSGQPIPWSTRMSIAIDIARGISFLHNLDTQVIYRDLKVSKILLDSVFKAKLSHFSLTRDALTEDDTRVAIQGQVVGTHGYAAPEYAARGGLTTKSDVYSFGVVLLELLTGKRVMDEIRPDFEKTLTDWAKSFLSDIRGVLKIVDTRLGYQYPKKEVQGAAALCLQCLHIDPNYRPAMRDVLATLEQLHTSRDHARTLGEKDSISNAG